MINYRAFRNTDPPAIADLWCNYPPRRALVQPMSASVLEQAVLAKPYFDRHDLIVAEQDDRVIGFVHGGFACTEDGCKISTDTGVTSMLMVAPGEHRQAVSAELLKRCEQQLIQKGARDLLAGCVYPANPFYLGLYGGSQSPGVLESNPELLDLCLAAGYQKGERRVVMQIKLASFRPPIDRRRRTLPRKFRILRKFDPPTNTWWEACTMGKMERTQFDVVSMSDRRHCGSIMFWNMEPLSNRWGLQAAGMMDLHIAPDCRRQGVGAYLVSEALRQVKETGISLAEIQLLEQNEAAIGLFAKLGFEQVDVGWVLKKEIPIA